MKFYGFNADYLVRLREGDPFVEQHFTAYFGELIFLKLRNRLRSRELIEDVQQETLLRVIRTLRTEAGVEHPERFGAFVNSVCNNVMRELVRQEHRHDPYDGGESPDVPDERVDLDGTIVNEERKRLVRKILDELSTRDRQVLRLLFLEEKSTREVCEQLGVDGDYLRVLVHRAKLRFKNKMTKTRGAVN